ncbi:GGDEF domain-containing protein [Micrococcales bacterium 31B]|nr:GGDEF domain-containing protein [Micrococcales bacterium 31B]
MQWPPSFTHKVEGPDIQLGNAILLIVTPLFWIIGPLAQVFSSGEAVPWLRVVAIAALVATSWGYGVAIAYMRVRVNETVILASCAYTIAAPLLCWALMPYNVPPLYVLLVIVPSVQLVVYVRSRVGHAFVTLIVALTVLTLVFAQGLSWLESVLVAALVGLPLMVTTSYLRRATDDLARHKQSLERLSRHDPLTGVLNRRGLRDALADHRAQGRRAGEVWMVLLDLDNFKHINDLEGHGEGDAVLREFVEHVKLQLSGNEYLARTGGEEFCIVTLSDGEVVAESIRAAIASARFTCTSHHITVSAGVIGPVDVSHLEPDDVWSYLHMADEALYRAKQAGRNRVEVGSMDASLVTRLPLPPQPEPHETLVREHSSSLLSWSVSLIFAAEVALLLLLAAVNSAGGVATKGYATLAALAILGLTTIGLSRLSGRSNLLTFAMLVPFELLVALISWFTPSVAGRVAVLALLPAVVVATIRLAPRSNTVHIIFVCVLGSWIFLGPEYDVTSIGGGYAVACVLMLWGVGDIVRAFHRHDARVAARAWMAAVRDPLTGAYNRRGLEDMAQRLPVGPRHLVVFDVDKFKLVNDHNGHSYGDAALRSLARRLQDEFGEESLVARLGGDEFVVVTSSPIDPAVERVTHAMQARGFNLTVSYGSVELDALQSPSDVWENVRRADHALLASRSRGSQRVA